MAPDQAKKLSAGRAFQVSEIKDHQQEIFFKDNLEHLEYLEYISRLRIIMAYLRNKDRTIENSIDKFLRDKPGFDFQVNFSEDVTIEELSEILQKIEAETNQKVHHSLNRGVELNFENFCKIYGIDEFERRIVMLFFANNTGKKFREFYALSKIDPHNRDDAGMSVGGILSILWPDYRDQIISRKYFSVEATLLKKGIVFFLGGLDSTENILDATLFIHERIIRFIIGDDNVYDTDLTFITKIKSSVKMDYVVLPDNLKKSVLNLANNYLSQKAQENFASMNDFYGYGTGMIFFLYGPSGTGKTMLAYALANALGKNLLVLNVENVLDNWIPFHRLLKHIFMEARLCNGIVLFDECDDIFRGNTSESRELLIEIEKAECITILATNKAIDLDPALDRRITMKVPFHLPDSDQREKIWKTLIPPNIKVGKDVDFKKLSKDYIFSGGLIKNSIFMAIINAMNKNGGSPNITLTADEIENAASHQSVSIFDFNGFGESYSSEKSIDKLPVRTSTKRVLEKVVSTYNRIKNKDTGINILIGSSSVQIGVDCVDAVAKACNLKIRKFLLEAIVYPERNASEEIKDLVSQKKVSLMEYAFRNSLGHQSLRLFVDYNDMFSNFLSAEQSDEKKSIICFLDKLKNYRGILFVVTKKIQSQLIPFEFDHYLKIDKPPEELQIRQWEKNLGENALPEEDLVDFVERHPLHLHEIDLLWKRASLFNYLNCHNAPVTVDMLSKTANRYKNIKGTEILFGNK